MNKENYYNAETKTMCYFIEGTESNNFNFHDVDAQNEIILADFYKAVDWIRGKQYDEYTELESNTINPYQQNAFIPLRVYKVKRNGHYKLIKLYQRGFGGICIMEENY